MLILTGRDFKAGLDGRDKRQGEASPRISRYLIYEGRRPLVGMTSRSAETVSPWASVSKSVSSTVFP